MDILRQLTQAKMGIKQIQDKEDASNALAHNLVTRRESRKTLTMTKSESLASQFRQLRSCSTKLMDFRGAIRLQGQKSVDSQQSNIQRQTLKVSIIVEDLF